MKGTCLLLLTIGCASLMNVRAYAASSNRASQQTSSDRAAKTTSDHSGGDQFAPVDDGTHGGRLSKVHQGGFADRNRSRTRVSRIGPNRAKPRLNNRRSRSGRFTSFHQQGSNESAAAAKGGSTPNGTLIHASPVRTLSMVRPATPSWNNVRHRDAKSASIGGPPNAARNAAINGTGMRRKA